MSRPTDEPTLATVQPGRPSGVPRAAIIAVVLIAVAIVKPWGGSALDAGPAGGGRPIGGARTASSGAGPGSTSAAATTSPDPNAISCTQPDGWRLVTLQQAKGLLTRTWLVVSGGMAAGPADIRGAVGRLAETNVVGLGFCAEGTVGQSEGTSAAVASGLAPEAPSAGPARIGGAWRRDARGAWVAFPTALAATGNGSPEGSGTALLYAPQPQPDGGATSAAPTVEDATWTPSAYAFRVEVFVGAVMIERWFRLDLVWPPVAETPSAAAATQVRGTSTPSPSH